MAQDIDEDRTWLDQPMTADELHQLLLQVKAALEAHEGSLCHDDLEARVEADRAASPALRI